MTEAKKYELHDLIQKIDQADKMVRLHADNPSVFMFQQYEAKKEKLLGYLIDELVDSKLRSPYSFRLIMLALKKYYPDLHKKSVDDKHYQELKYLEAVLA